MLTKLDVTVTQCTNTQQNTTQKHTQTLDTDPDPDHHQNLIICSLAYCQLIFPKNFMQIRSEVFAQSC